MKKQVAVILLGVLCIASGCKKSNSNGSNDSGAAISEKTWWGELTNQDEKSQYYSVHFNSDGSFVWNQALGEYFGDWSLSGNHLTLSFRDLSVVVEADITGGNKWVNIKTNNTSTVDNGQLFTSPNQKALDGTVWKGTYKDLHDVSYTLEIDFQDAVNMQVTIGNSAAASYTYFRSTSGVIIRTPQASMDSHVYFGLIMSDTQMQGTDINPDNRWQVTKQ